MSEFAEYLEHWKQQDEALKKRLFSLKKKIWQTLPSISAKLKFLGAKEVIVFGSVVEGDIKLDSDIDIAVKGLPYDKYIEAIIEVEKILAPINVGFDLILYERSYPWIKEKIEQGKKL